MNYKKTKVENPDAPVLEFVPGINPFNIKKATKIKEDDEKAQARKAIRTYKQLEFKNELRSLAFQRKMALEQYRAKYQKERNEKEH